MLIRIPRFLIHLIPLKKDQEKLEKLKRYFESINFWKRIKKLEQENNAFRDFLESLPPTAHNIRVKKDKEGNFTISFDDM